MNNSQEQINRWKRDAQIAYHTKAYEGSFDRYWAVTAVLRTNSDENYWEDAKKVKLEAWNTESLK